MIEFTESNLEDIKAYLEDNFDERPTRAQLEDIIQFFNDMIERQ